MHWERPRSRSGFTSVETLECIEESCAARFAGDHDQYRALSRRTRTLLRRYKERYVRGLTDDVECHLNANDLRPAYRAMKKLRSKSTSQVSAIRTADWTQMGRWLLGLSTFNSCSRWILQADSCRLQGCRRWMLIHSLTKLHPPLAMSKRLWQS